MDFEYNEKKRKLFYKEGNSVGYSFFRKKNSTMVKPIGKIATFAFEFGYLFPGWGKV